MSYTEFLQRKAQLDGDHGFKPVWTPDFLFDFQKHLVERSLLKGRSAIFADCGLGKTPMQLVFAENVARKTKGNILIITPLAVSGQTVAEGVKFDIGVTHSREGKADRITVTNYERLHYFNCNDFTGVICDESSILKNFDGATKAAITEFMRRIPYRLLCTATAAPNDYIELGTSSEALGYLGYMDMLKMFFKSADGATANVGKRRGHFDKNPFSGKFRFRGHAEQQFWRWVCSWARAIRKPSDLGFSDDNFALPLLKIIQHTIKATSRNEDFLFDLPAHGLAEQRHERRRTLTERCEKAAQLATTDKTVVSWCNLNDEGDLLTKLIPDAVQISGNDEDEKKEEIFAAFAKGEVRSLVTKSTIAGFGLNWQHCAHQTFFPSHSFEQWYQSIRRSWRFGQKNPVTIDVITSEGEASVLSNLNRKALSAEEMFTRLVSLMNNELNVKQTNTHTKKQTIPKWLSSTK